MRKIFSLILALSMVIAFSACGNRENVSSLSNPDTSSADSAQGFVAPESYAYVINLSINPEFDLYLDIEDDVIAINALNDDAKSFINDIDLSDRDHNDVIESIVKLAASKGFIKENGHIISVNLKDIKSAQINTNEILADASEAIDDAAKDLKLNLKAKTSITQNSANNESSNHTSSTVSTPNSNQISSNSSQSNSIAHTCSFSAASCTKPATCACGKTSGKALGHKWTQATCNFRKTCTVCKIEEGELAPHNYVEGFCTVCKQFEPMDPKKYLKLNVEYIGNFRISGDELLASAIMFDGEACVLTDRFFSSTQTDPEQQPIIYKGKKYYSEGGGMEPYSYNIKDKKIEVTKSFYNESADGTNLGIYVLYDGRLIVKSTRFIEYPAGSVYSTDINEALK